MAVPVDSWCLLLDAAGCCSLDQLPLVSIRIKEEEEGGGKGGEPRVPIAVAADGRSVGRTGAIVSCWLFFYSSSLRTATTLRTTLQSSTRRIKRIAPPFIDAMSLLLTHVQPSRCQCQCHYSNRVSKYTAVTHTNELSRSRLRRRRRHRLRWVGALRPRPTVSNCHSQKTLRVHGNISPFFYSSLELLLLLQ